MANDGKRGAAEIRREASAWIVRMRGPEAERSRFEFERWRAADAAHRRIYAEMEAISGGTRQLGAYALGYRGLRERRPVLVRPALRLALASIAAVLLVGAGLLVFRTSPGTPTVIASDGGRIRRLRLPDGTGVILDAGAKIELAYNRSARLVRLVEGRARFDVAAAPGRPFMVEADGRLILDRGTVFDVGVGRDGVKVTLLRGSVEIHDRGASGDAGPFLARLVPGQVATALAGSERPAVVTAPVGSDRWVDGVLSYDRAPLADVVSDIDRYATHQVRLGDPALADLRVTGVFRAMPTENAARALAAALGLHLASAANGDLILTR